MYRRRLRYRYSGSVVYRWGAWPAFTTRSPSIAGGWRDLGTTISRCIKHDISQYKFMIRHCTHMEYKAGSEKIIFFKRC